MMTSLNKKINKKGFTIVETLVAVTILMIAIAGPLSVASRGLSASIYARDQMTATFLAQESMEIIKNTRDNTIARVGADRWMDDLVQCITTPENGQCDAGFQGINDMIAFRCPIVGDTPGCKLYLINGYYTQYQQDGAIPTQFYRYFSLTNNNTLPRNDSYMEKTVTVVVSWRAGGVPYRVELASQLLNVLR